MKKWRKSRNERKMKLRTQFIYLSYYTELLLIIYIISEDKVCLFHTNISDEGAID